MSVTNVYKAGVVKRVDGNRAIVRVSCKGDECAGCKAALICSPNKDAQELTVDIPYGRLLSVGDDVRLVGRLRGWFAGWMLLAGFPCVAVLAAVCLGMWLKWSDVANGLLALGVLIAYYLIIYQVRSHINNRVVWELE